MFHDTAKRGKSSTGWFYGFKLLLAINERGEILNFRLTPENVDDRNEEVMEAVTKNLFADKGYLSQKLFEKLWEKGVELVTKKKKNAKNPKMMRYSDRLLLRKRAVIESMIDF